MHPLALLRPPDPGRQAGSQVGPGSQHAALPCPRGPRPRGPGCGKRTGGCSGSGQAAAGILLSEESAPCFPVGTTPADTERVWVCDGLLALRCRWAAVNQTGSGAGPKRPVATCILLLLCLLVTIEFM